MFSFFKLSAATRCSSDGSGFCKDDECAEDVWKRWPLPEPVAGEGVCFAVASAVSSDICRLCEGEFTLEL